MNLFVLLLVLCSTVIDANSFAEIERMIGPGMGQVANPAIASKVASPDQFASPLLLPKLLADPIPVVLLLAVVSLDR